MPRKKLNRAKIRVKGKYVNKTNRHEVEKTIAGEIYRFMINPDEIFEFYYLKNKGVNKKHNLTEGKVGLK